MMTEATHLSSLWPADWTEEAAVWLAAGILMRRLDLHAWRAFELVRENAESTGMRMCVIAEQIINAA